MASLWLKLFFISLIYLNVIAKSTPHQETEFECVSIDKQSALQHPLMKNHRIQTRPSRELLSILSTSKDDRIRKIDSKGLEECPKGQVPIHKPKTNNLVHPQHIPRAGRLLKQTRSHKVKKKKKNNRRKNDKNKLISSALLSQKNKKPIHRPKLFTETHLHYAIVRTFENTTKKWRGAQALFSINKPRVVQNQFSKAWIWLNYIQGSVMSSIQFGWAVHTNLYPDDRPRLTTFWMSDNHQKGCYNALCPGGYVQIHKSIYPGLVYDKINVPGGKQNTVHLSVAEDPVTKNWVLTIGSIMIGYWPRQSHMAEGASEVYFGGFAGISDLSRPTTSPPMGTGDFPTKDLSRSCFMKQLKYVLSDYTVVDINPNEVEDYVDNRKCYGLMFHKYVDYDSRETLTFGGPGGQC
ncbi:Neprosin activation peptide [Arabidopsis suecica]|uniref:Neprosin activation peptide n=1 Tax=Arabidopsis suecica TaxID=45249 RepID=A0A8T1XN14_ARASU|nr:Neprosin activation peptide [Arabidopsis suecica]